MSSAVRSERWAALGRGIRLPVRLPVLVRRWWRLCSRRELQALVVCAACALQYFAVIQPERARLETALRQTSALQLKRPVPVAQPDPAAAELGRFYARFPSQAVFPDSLGQLLKTAAAHALNVNDGEYTVARETTGRLVRFQIVLPLRGTYPQVRGFLTALAHEVPGMVLENARFERHEIGDPTLDVRLRLVLFLARVP